MKKIIGPDPLADRTPGTRKIRSFVLREGRLTPAQELALEELWPRFGVELDNSELGWEELFGRNAPCHLEIGFGDGEALLHAAREFPENNYLGIEVHRPGVGQLLRGIEEYELENLRVACCDALTLLERQIPAASLAAVRLYFPDPWPKKRHHKRRIVQPTFMDIVASRLEDGGMLHMATDWENYAEHMREIVEPRSDFTNVAGPGESSERPPWRPVTKFERRGRKLGHGVWDLIYKYHAK